jgi:hypothetical protein
VTFEESATSATIITICHQLTDASGNSKIMYEIPAGAAWVDHIVPSPDGRSLAFTKRTYVNCVMLLEDF